MKLWKFSLFLLVLVFTQYNGISSKRWGGSSNRGSSGSRWGGSSKPRPSYKPSAPTSFHNDKTSSSSFLHTESGRPSFPSKQGAVHEQHQQSSASVAHSDPYQKQPAYNPHVTNGPYVPSGGYGQSSHIPAAPHGISVPSVNGHSSVPYPSLPNHPHPNPGLSSSSFPSNAHPPPYNAPIHSQSYPNVHGSAPPPYTPNFGGSPYHAGGYHSPPAYHAPAYQPASAPFVPGRTVYVVPESSKHSSSGGPGLGTYIASGVAGGVAAGATNAIVDHAISSIFRSNPSHVHTYPSAPPVGTPTSSITTNNYYYGQSGPNDTGSNTNANNPASGTATGGQPLPQNVVGQPAQVVSPTFQANPGVTNPARDVQGNPSTATNGAVSRAPGEGQPENVAPTNNEISDENLMRFFEELFEKQDKNMNQFVELNLQKRVNNIEQGKAIPDEAPEALFNLKPELDTIPTVIAIRALYDNYQRNGTQKEIVTPERRNEENNFLDEIVKTPVMSRALDWLVEKKYIESDDYEKKDVLRRIWFNNFDGTSSGFERIFLSEKFDDSAIMGMQNWLYFAHLESQKNVDYLGYVDQLSLSGKGSLLKLNYKTEGFTIQNATIFIGTAPELELALYTICFYARPNNWCPVSLGGAKFFILTHSFRYYGKDLIDVGFPAF